jgi:hypothetical protein
MPPPLVRGDASIGADEAALGTIKVGSNII